ncbi:MAG: outer membrane protein assembly factor BamD [Marinovum algicola]|nr:MULTISPECIES: outer membrane protein assembly factor BamD [Marinovum]MDD9741088.1 outer membrane protein assembly factor BamD [Marinovum sp. SP66]
MARLRVPAVVGLALLGFSGCTDLAAPSGGGFQQQYFAARDALETGRYDAAARSYQKLLKNYPAGAVEARLMLELSHAQLRGGDYEAASRAARSLAASQTGPVRGMALAVAASADHEIARSAIAAGDRGAATRQRLQAAASALDELLAEYPGLDIGKAMARRRALITSELAALG